MQHPDLTESFKKIFERLLAGDNLAGHENGLREVAPAHQLSALLAVVATNLLGNSKHYVGCYFDGAIGITAKLRSPRTIEIQGEIWIGRDRKQWTEPFRVKVVDKQITKQGIWITIWIGQERGEGESIFALQRLDSRK
jgi:hypothetical protein